MRSLARLARRAPVVGRVGELDHGVHEERGGVQRHVEEVRLG